MPRVVFEPLCLAIEFALEGQQSQMTGTFDGASQLALVLGAGSGLASRADFAIFCYVPAQCFTLFVVNHCVVVGAELANLRR